MRCSKCSEQLADAGHWSQHIDNGVPIQAYWRVCEKCKHIPIKTSEVT